MLTNVTTKSCLCDGGYSNSMGFIMVCPNNFNYSLRMFLILPGLIRSPSYKACCLPRRLANILLNTSWMPETTQKLTFLHLFIPTHSINDGPIITKLTNSPSTSKQPISLWMSTVTLKLVYLCCGPWMTSCSLYYCLLTSNFRKGMFGYDEGHALCRGGHWRQGNYVWGGNHLFVLLSGSLLQ
jgi:hypothetical protein